MQRTVKLTLIKTLPLGKVEVEDTEGLRWIVGKEAYSKFKWTGFLHVAKALAKEFNFILAGRNFGSLTEKEKAIVITKILEGATGEPITSILPNYEN